MSVKRAGWKKRKSTKKREWKQSLVKKFMNVKKKRVKGKAKRKILWQKQKKKKKGRAIFLSFGKNIKV